MWLDVMVGDHSVAFPFGNVGPGLIHPALSVGIEHAPVERGSFSLVHGVRAGVRTHLTGGNAVDLITDLRPRWSPAFGLVADTGLTLGVSDTFRGKVLAWDGEEYRQVTDSGQLGVTAGFEFGVGYDLARVAHLPVTVHLDYAWYAAIPWLPAVPLGPQATVSLGVRVALGGDQ